MDKDKLQKSTMVQTLIEVSNALPMGVFWFSESGHVVACNNHLLNDLGYEANSAPTSFLEINPTFTLLDFKKLWKALKEKGSVNFQSEHINQDDLIYPVSMMGVLLTIEETDICVAISENLMPAKRFEDLLKLTSEVANIGGWEWDRVKNEFTLTEVARKILGLPSTAPYGMSDFMTFLDQSVNKKHSKTLSKYIEKAIESGKSYELSFNALIGNVHKDLRVVGIAEHIEGQTIKLYGTIQDEGDAANRTEELYFAQYCMEYSVDMVYWIDSDWNIQYLNSTACELIGYSKKEIIGKPLLLIDPEVEPHLDNIRTKLEANERFTVDTYHTTRSGDKVPVLVETEKISYRGQSYYVCFVKNMTGLHAKDELIEMTQATMDIALDMIYWFDDKGTIQYVNKTACETLGYAKEELMGQPVTFITTRSAEDLAPMKTKLELEKQISFDSTHVTKSGETIPVKVEAQWLTFKGSAYNCTFVRDQRSNKEKDELLEISQVTINNASEMIYWIDENGVIDFVNDRACENMGYTREELLGNSIGIFNPEGFSAWPDHFKELEEQKQLEFETFHYTKTGNIIPVRVSANYLSYKGKKYNCGFVKDLSFKKSRDELIKMAKTSVDNSLDMIFWLDESAQFKYCNKIFKKTTGYTDKDLSTLTIVDIITDQNMEGFQKGWEKLKNGAVLQNMPRNLLLKDGTILPVSMSVFIVELEGNFFTTTVMRDMTAQLEKEAKINTQITEIERLKNEAIAENVSLKEDIQLQANITNIISKDPAYKKVLKQIEQVAVTDATALILGETGTGKELVANAIHQLSNRSEELMIKVNCGALPENLIESEFFGHEKGAFTGAHQQKIGKFERAHKATIFLDEIGELPLDLQSKLLRVLQEGEFERVGGTQTIKVDVRVIAATNRSLEKRIAKGKFREDLYYRLNVFPIHNIPLRERREDIPLLLDFFIKKYSKKSNKVITEINQTSLDALYAYPFPGNVRELENLVERAVILTTGNVLKIDLGGLRKTRVRSSKLLSMDEMIKTHIIDALRRCQGRVTGPMGAASLLGLKDKTLYSKMTKYGIKRTDYLKTNSK